MTTRFGPRIHRLEVPLPFAMAPLNAWLVDTGDGWALIDTGMQTRAAWKALDSAIADTGITWSDVKTVIVTHMHPDHAGLLPQVIQASGAEAAMHIRDAELLREFAQPETAAHWNGVALAMAGSPPKMIEPVNAAFRLLTVKFPDIEPERLLQGGEHFGSLDVIWSPGHSPGHICMIDRERKLMFSGDHLLETTSPNIGWLPEGDPLADYLASLREIEAMPIDLVLSGHGAPIRDHRAWIRRTASHHAARLERIRDIAAERPSTAHEISLRLWNRELGPIDYRFAIFEVLSHLVHLTGQGELRHEGSLWSL